MKTFIKYVLGLVLVALFIFLNFTVKMDLPIRFLNPMILSLVLCLYRIFIGPSPADRAVATDILGLLIVGICGILSVFKNAAFFIDISIAWALQSFIGNLALAKYLEGKKFDE
ncbi:MAG: monovalent cation/H+ antiporter complex subunit F [Endomicrobia bacterium]|nr:monovalent cation/H+ antiporter complex subunit F [Endomicrobiia bacterium]MCX7940533.1 monovalent cation/H+ antiporter complex subunit F [Endomicrobiia bacterium]MDW8056018.1 monovalent cation/H+ antiporter complex subunit F [Elusimicrobiota bacterium]